MATPRVVGTYARDVPADHAIDLRVALLGPVQVYVAGQVLPVTSRLQRAALAFLALNAGHVVSTARLIDALWGERAPDTVTAALQVHISGLRKALGTAAPLLVTRAPGYVLVIPEEHVDVLAFEASMRTAHAHPGVAPPPRVTWGDDVLDDLGDVPFVAAVQARLQQLRWACLEDQVEAELAAGHHGGVVADVELMLREQPYRERLWRALIIALYRAGRQADALDAYRRAAGLLADDLGLDPGPALVAVHQAVLTSDPALMAPADGRPERARLPERQGRLIGRDDELKALIAAIGEERVVTLTGPGGVGKTTLAHEAALRITEDEPSVEGLLVDLAVVTDPRSVLPAIAQQLNIPLPEGPEADLVHAVAGFLGQRRVLVLLDTMEHLRPAGQVLANLVKAAPGVRLLITSRTSLGLAHERVVSLGPLSVPAAAELFVHRARGSSVPLDAGDRLVAALCERLDGIPLALELAAARCRLMDPRDLLARLDVGLTPLGGSSQDRPERHQTMQATLAWSVNLLPPSAQILFRRWGAIAGALALDDLLTILDGGEAGDAERLMVDLDTLVDASLVSISGGRYRMLDMVRGFAGELLEASDEARQVRRHHVEWALTRCERAVAAYEGPGEDLAVAGLREMLADLRLAASTAFLNNWHEDGARIVLGARRGWFSAGLLTEMTVLLDQAAAGDLAPATAAGVLGMTAIARKIRGAAGADDLGAAAAALRPHASGKVMLVNVLCHQAALLAESDRAEAVSVAAEAVEVARGSTTGDVSMALDLSGYVARLVGDRELAVALAEEAVEVAQGQGTQLALSLAGLSASLAEAGRPREALDRGLEALARVRVSGAPAIKAEVLTAVTMALSPDVQLSLVHELADAVAVCVAYGNHRSAAELILVLARLGIPDQATSAATLLAAAQRMAPDPDADDGRAPLLAALGETRYAMARAQGMVLGDDDVVRLAREVAERLVAR
jgi:predicted ATPase/DNA-binding SARP family transcriptional activator